jgi:DNA-binding protein YbaB
MRVDNRLGEHGDASIAGMDMRHQVDALCEAMEELDRQRQELEAVEVSIRDSLVSGTSEDGVARVVCNGTGHVHEVRLEENLLAGLSAQQLCLAVIEARNIARDAARQAASARRSEDGWLSEGHRHG